MIFSLIGYGVLSTVNNLTKAIDLLRLELKIVNEINRLDSQRDSGPGTSSIHKNLTIESVVRFFLA